MDITSKRIKALREARGLRQGDVAALIGISQSVASSYENGRDLPSDVLISYANKFNISTDYLLGLTDEPTSKKDNAQLAFSSLFTSEPYSFSLGDIISLAKQFTDYYTAGAPAGAAPMQAFKGYLSAMGGVLSAATAKDITALLIQANALGACCLQANEILHTYMANQKG